MTKIEPREGVVAQKVGEETVLLDIDSNQYFGLNAVGSSFWNRIEAGDSLEQAHAALLDEYDVDTHVLAQDLNELVGQLSGAGLITVQS